MITHQNKIASLFEFINLNMKKKYEKKTIYIETNESQQEKKLGILNRNVFEINVNFGNLKEENRKQLKLNARKFIAI